MTVAARARRRRNREHSYLSVDWSNPINWEDSLNTGLVSWWLAVPHWQGNQTVWKDLCKRNEGTLTNGPTWQRAIGRPGGWGALETTTSAYVTTPYTHLFDSLAGITMAFWGRHDTVVDATDVGMKLIDIEGGFDILQLGRKHSPLALQAFLRDFGGAGDFTATCSPFPDFGVWAHYACTWASNGNLTAYINGVAGTPTATTIAAFNDANRTCRMALSGGDVPGWPGLLDDARVYGRALTDREVMAVYQDSLQGSPRTLRRWGTRGIKKPSSGYPPIAVDSGSYIMTGSSVGLSWGRKIPVGSGSYSLAGASVGLKRGYPIVVGAGSYSISGSAITFKHDWKLPIGLGSYTLTGSSVGLKRDYPIIVGTGSYTLSGSSVGLKRGYPLSVGAGSYTLSGSDVDLITTLKIEVGAGSYTLTGKDITFALSHKIAIGSGTYTIGGSSVGLKRGYPLVIGAGSYSLNGSNVNLKFGHVVTVGSGTYTITGASVNLIDSGEDARLDVESGSYTLTGSDVNLKFGHKLIVGSATYTLTGSAIGLGFGPHVGIGSGSYIISGSSVGLRYGRSLIVGSGNYAITGSNVTFYWHHDLAIGSGSYIITGAAVNLFTAQAIVGSGKIVLCNVFVPGPQQVFTHVPGPILVEV